MSDRIRSFNRWAISLLTIASLTIGLPEHLAAATFKGKIHTIPLPDKTLSIELSGVNESATWAVGAVVTEGPDAKVVILRSPVRKSQPMSMLEGVSELSPDHVAIRPGSCKLAMPALDASSIGVFVQAPRDTAIRVTVNGTLFSATTLSAPVMLQDGTLKNDAPKSMSAFFLRMHTADPPPQTGLIRRGGVIFASATDAHDHVLSSARPSPVAAGCCGNRLIVHVEISIDSAGNVTGVSRTAATAQIEVGPLESIIGSWKFRPFEFEGKAVAVRVVAPIVFAENTVFSPLF